MKTFKEFTKEFELAKVRLARVFMNFKNEKTVVAIITAFRGEEKPEINIWQNKMLASDITNAGYGFIYVDGHFLEKNKNTGKLEKVKESSILINAGSGTVGKSESGKLKGFLKKWIGKYDQESALFKDEGTTEIVLLDRNGKKEKISNKFSVKALEGGYTKLRGRSERTFSFTGIHEGLGVFQNMEWKMLEQEGKFLEQEERRKRES